MDLRHSDNETPSQQPEKKEFSNKNKILALIASVAVLGGGVVFLKSDKEPVNPSVTENPIEQSSDSAATVIENSQKSNESKDNNSSESDKVTTKYKGKISIDKCPDPKAASCTITYKDPCSGETVITNPNQTPETNGRVNNVIILGSSRLTEVGITDNQKKKLWAELSDYAASQKEPIKEIGICVKTIDRINTDEETGKNSIDFTITVDRKNDLNAKITYSGLNNIDLEISNPESKDQLFNSVK